MCLCDKQAWPKNKTELDLYKGFDCREDGLHSVYEYGDDTIPAYPEQTWVQAKPRADHLNGPIEGFHAFVDRKAAKSWINYHGYTNRSTVRKVTFRGILSEGRDEYDGVKAYTALEMFIHPPEQSKEISHVND
jgi:hypothetical protein